MLPERILSEIESSRSELVEVCSQLIRRPTQHPDGETKECVAYVEKYFDELGIETEVYLLEENKPNIVARVKGQSDKKILWVGHLDVVPEGKPENWTYLPFSGKVTEDGMIWGRGSTDMKGACAAAMVSARVLSEFGAPNSVDFWFTADEEIGGGAGVRWLAEEGVFKGEVAIIGDGGGCNPGSVNIGVGNKGGIGTRLIARGKTAHGSTPYLGDNAIEKLIRVIPYVKRIGDFHLELPPELEPIIKSSVDLLLRDKRLTEAQRLAVKRLYDYPSGPSLNIFNGGVKSNVVPDYAEAYFDIRLTPGCDPMKVKERIEGLVAKAGVSGVTVHARAGATAGYYEPADSPNVRLLSEAVQIVTGVQPAMTIAPWGTDAVHIKERGIPCLIFGPMLEDLLHQPDERVPIENLVTSTKVYALFPFIYGK